MGDLDLDRLEELCAEATAGPWTLLPATFSPRIYVMCKGYGLDDAAIAEARDRPDAAFIAAAREALPALIKRVRELEGPLEGLTNFAW